MMKPDLNKREHIEKLVKTFYSKVKQDELLGPFFNARIKGEKAWEEHLKLLVDFWDLNLLEKKGFNGNPAMAHQKVDKSFKHSISTTHFDRWVEIWTATIDQSFEGEMAEKAKTKANNMAKGMYKKILDKRPGGFILPGSGTDLKFG